VVKGRRFQFPNRVSPITPGVPGDRLVSSREARAITGLSATTMWRLRRQDRFPEPVQISPRRKGYLASELNAWLQIQIDASRRDRQTI
jgi:predicted DNA-binding transcriptional regulator AlpA